MNKIKWLFFDIGGVLLDDRIPEKKHLDILYEVVRRFNHHIRRHEMDLIRIKMSHQTGQLGNSILEYLLKENNILEKAKKEYHNRQPEIGYFENSKIRPEAKEVLEKLSKKYQLGIIANQNSQIKEKLKEAGIYQLLHHQTVSEEHGLRKPDPKYFQAVFEETGAIPRESAIIDDNIERGLIPAKKLGMTTIWYKTRERDNISHQHIDFTVTSLENLLELFK